MGKLPSAIQKNKRTNNKSEKSGRGFTLPFNKKVSRDQVVEFTRSFSILVEARLPLVEALDILQRQMAEAPIQEVIKSVKKSVERGESLAKGLSKYPDTFDPLYINLVEVGEAAGVLDEVLDRIAGHLEKARELRQKIRSALMYPALVLVVSVAALLFLLAVIVPTFTGMYRDFEAKLPYLTSLVIDSSSFVKQYFLYLTGGIAAVIWFGRQYVETQQGRYVFDRFKISMPLFGGLIKKSLTARYTQTLGTLLKSGISLTESLRLAKTSTGNRLYEDVTQKAILTVERGGSLAKTFARSTLFPPMVAQMISVGEETARLDNMLLHISKSLTREVDTAVDGLTSIIEPLLIVFLGVVLGGVIIAMYLPIFELMNVVQ